MSFKSNVEKHQTLSTFMTLLECFDRDSLESLFMNVMKTHVEQFC